MKRAAMNSTLSLLLLAALVGAGCGNESPATGNGAALVEQVDVGTWSSAQLYYAPEVSSRLMTAEELGDTSGAIPVRLEFLDTVAVAWYAPHGQAIVSHDTLIAAFPIGTSPTTFSFDADGTQVQPLIGETHPATVSTPSRATGGLSGPAGTYGTLTPAGSHPEAGPIGLPNPSTFLRWQGLVRENPGLISAIGRYHPGCG